MFKTLASLFLAFSVVQASAADWEGVFEGTLGKSRIIVQLVEPQDDMEGNTGRETSRYSYVPKSRDLNLILSKPGMPLAFEETPLLYYEFSGAQGDERKVTGKWALTVDGNSALGTWTSPDGKKSFPIHLSRVEMLREGAFNPDENVVNATYDAQWLKHVTFADVGRSKSFGPVEVRMVKDSAFGIEYPVLGAFPNAARKAKANELLMATHRQSVAQYRNCKNGVSSGWEEAEGEPEFSNEIKFASPTVLAFTESGSVFCGGAHPSNYTNPYTYDLTAPVQIGGKYELDLSPQGFGHMLKLANKEERAAFERFALGRWKEAEAKDTEMEGACSTGWIEESPEGEKIFSLSLTETGLAVHRTDYPHVASVCLFTEFNPTIIPYAELKPWLKPGQNLLP